MPTHTGEGHLLYSADLPIQMLNHSGNALRDAVETMFYQLPGHPLAQSSLPRKLPIMALYFFPFLILIFGIL